MMMFLAGPRKDNNDDDNNDEDEDEDVLAGWLVE